MTTMSIPGITPRVSPSAAVSQTLTMAWRATKKMRRNPDASNQNTPVSSATSIDGEKRQSNALISTVAASISSDETTHARTPEISDNASA